MPQTPSARHLLIPYAGRGSPACQAALPGLRLPNLEKLLTHLALAHEDLQDASTLSPPHERALAAALGLAAPDGCIPWAALEAREAGLAYAQPGEGWGWLHLCHWQVGIDDVVLGDPGRLEIDAVESAALLATAGPFFAEDGIALHPTLRPGRWLAHGKLFLGLPTASVERAVGHPISEWSPLSDAARPLRRLQNEMQMLLYTQRVNDARTERGAPPLNSFWLSGTGGLPEALVPAGPAPVVDPALRDAALHDDAGAWTQAWQALDAGVVAALLDDCQRGTEVRLTLCGDRGARSYASGGPSSLLARFARRFRRADVPAQLAAL